MWLCSYTILTFLWTSLSYICSFFFVFDGPNTPSYNLTHNNNWNVWIIVTNLCSGSHGPGAECCRSLRPHAIRVPGIVAWGRGAATDPQPPCGDQPGRCRPVPGPGSHQLLLHLWPRPDETPTLFRGKAAVYGWGKKGKHSSTTQLTEYCLKRY